MEITEALLKVYGLFLTTFVPYIVSMSEPEIILYIDSLKKILRVPGKTVERSAAKSYVGKVACPFIKEVPLLTGGVRKKTGEGMVGWVSIWITDFEIFSYLFWVYE